MIQASRLQSVEDVPLYTIGYWAALLRHTRAKLQKLNETAALSGGEEATWMEALAKVDDFSYAPMSIEKFRSEFPSPDFCVFLDEFLSDPWCVYVRNLARYLKVPCIVSNTNTNIANLVGVAHASRGPDPVTDARGTFEEVDAWSLIFYRFGCFNRRLVTDAFSNGETLDSLISRLKDKCLDIADAKVRNYFDHLFGRGLDATRPGIAVIVIQKLQALVRGQPMPLSVMIQRIITALSDEIRFRKPQMEFDNAQLPKLGLLVPHSYRETVPDPDDDDDAIFNYKSFMDDHLYHLLSPVNHNRPFFLTFTPRFRSRFLRYFDGSNLIMWKTEYTTFKSQDFFTIMACLNIPFKIPTTTCLTLNYVRYGVKGFTYGDISNPNALKRSGNRLEVSAAVGITDSTHFDASDAGAVYNLSGQSAPSFLTNLLRNCFYDVSGNSRSSKFAVEFTGPLQNWLSGRIKFPFLQGIDVSNFSAIFNDLARDDDSIFVRTYERCADVEKIDGFFTFDEGGVIRGCSIECKNSVLLNVTTLNSALIKAFDPRKKFANHQLKPRLMLIFCHLIDPSATDKNALYDFCHSFEEVKVNLYRTCFVNDNCVKIEPFLEGWELHASPDCHAIVIETPIAKLMN